MFDNSFTVLMNFQVMELPNKGCRWMKKLMQENEKKILQLFKLLSINIDVDVISFTFKFNF